MIASNVTRETLENAAAEIGVSVDVRTLSGSGLRHRVKVSPLVGPSAYTASGRRKRGPAGDAKYQRESASLYNAGARVHAVCWHGFRDFFRAVFKVCPDARFKTALDVWNGSDDFEARFRDSGQVNAGSPMAPIAHAAACRCPEAGWAR